MKARLEREQPLTEVPCYCGLVGMFAGVEWY